MEGRNGDIRTRMAGSQSGNVESHSRYFNEKIPRVPATSALEAWKTLETSFHRIQVFQLRETQDGPKCTRNGCWWRFRVFEIRRPCWRTGTLEHRRILLTLAKPARPDPPWAVP